MMFVEIFKIEALPLFGAVEILKNVLFIGPSNRWFKVYSK